MYVQNGQVVIDEDEKDTSSQLFRWLRHVKTGNSAGTFTGYLNEEAQELIQKYSGDLEKLEKEAEAIHFFDHTLFG